MADPSKESITLAGKIGAKWLEFVKKYEKENPELFDAKKMMDDLIVWTARELEFAAIEIVEGIQIARSEEPEPCFTDRDGDGVSQCWGCYRYFKYAELNEDKQCSDCSEMT